MDISLSQVGKHNMSIQLSFLVYELSADKGLWSKWWPILLEIWLQKHKR